MGHEPQNEIDSRANYDIVMASKIVEPDDRMTQIKHALYFADDFINCSKNHSKGLQRIISKRHPKTKDILNTVLEFEETKNLSMLENASTLPTKIIKQFNLSGSWSASDSINFLKNAISNLNTL